MSPLPRLRSRKKAILPIINQTTTRKANVTVDDPLDLLLRLAALVREAGHPVSLPVETTQLFDKLFELFNDEELHLPVDWEEWFFHFMPDRDKQRSTASPFVAAVVSQALADILCRRRFDRAHFIEILISSVGVDINVDRSADGRTEFTSGPAFLRDFGYCVSVAERNHDGKP